ncbi:STY0301 family protein [Oxalobacteraceae bacterium A2-2]
MMRTLFLTLLVLSATADSAAAPAQQYVCPASIPVSVKANAGNGWIPHVASDLYLNSATPISGPPEMKADLADYLSRPGKKEWSYTYDLARPFPDGKWLECGYGTHNEVTLSRRLPDTVKQCIFTYRKGARAGQHEIRISCQ